MIAEDYVSYEVAKLLEKKGFPMIEQLFMYVNKNNVFMTHNYACLKLSLEEYKNFDEVYIPTITHQMAMKWLRKKHKLHISVAPYLNKDGEITWVWEIIHIESAAVIIADSFYGDDFDSCEEAVEAALKYCLTKLI